MSEEHIAQLIKNVIPDIDGPGQDIWSPGSWEWKTGAHSTVQERFNEAFEMVLCQHQGSRMSADSLPPFLRLQYWKLLDSCGYSCHHALRLLLLMFGVWAGASTWQRSQKDHRDFPEIRLPNGHEEERMLGDLLLRLFVAHLSSNRSEVLFPSAAYLMYRSVDHCREDTQRMAQLFSDVMNINYGVREAQLLVDGLPALEKSVPEGHQLIDMLRETRDDLPQKYQAANFATSETLDLLDTFSYLYTADDRQKLRKLICDTIVVSENKIEPTDNEGAYRKPAAS